MKIENLQFCKLMKHVQVSENSRFPFIIDLNSHGFTNIDPGKN